MLNYFPIYVARVTDTGLGASGLNIKAGNNFIPAEAGEIYPLLDGLVKSPPPTVGEYVLVLQADASNINRWYMPIRSSFTNLTQTADNIQLESAGNVDLEGTTINLGAGTTEPAVLGDTLKTQLEDLITQIVSITVPTAVGPSGPPINSTAIQALSSLLVNILSGKVRVE